MASRPARGGARRAALGSSLGALGVPLCAAALVVGAGTASAQTRPLLTEPAATAAAGTLRLDAGGQGIADEPNFLTGEPRDRYELPQLRVVYSPAGNVELDIGWTARILAPDDPTFGDASDWGDVSLHAKWRFRGATPHGPALAARFGVTLPETRSDAGLGPNTLRMSAQLLLSQPAGRATLHASAGLALDDEPLSPHSQSDFLAYGVALELRAGRSVALVAEVAGLAGNGAPGADAHAELRAGLRVGDERLRGDVALRRGLMDADGTWGLTLGASWRLRAGRAPRI